MRLTANYPVTAIGIPPRKSEAHLCVINRQFEFDIPLYDDDEAPKVMDIRGLNSVAGETGGIMSVRHVHGRLYREVMSLEAFKCSLTAPLGRPPAGFEYRSAIFRLHNPMWQRTKEAIEKNYEVGGPRIWPTDIEFLFERDGRVNQTFTRIKKPLEAFHRYPGIIPAGAASQVLANEDELFADVISDYAIIEGRVYVATVEPFYTVWKNDIDFNFPDAIFDKKYFPNRFSNTLFFDWDAQHVAFDFIRSVTGLSVNGIGALPNVEIYSSDYRPKHDGTSLSILSMARRLLRVAEDKGLLPDEQFVELTRIGVLVSQVSPNVPIPSELKDLVLNITEEILTSPRNSRIFGLPLNGNDREMVLLFQNYIDNSPVNVGLQRSASPNAFK